MKTTTEVNKGDINADLTKNILHCFFKTAKYKPIVIFLVKIILAFM